MPDVLPVMTMHNMTYMRCGYLDAKPSVQDLTTIIKLCMFPITMYNFHCNIGRYHVLQLTNLAILVFLYMYTLHVIVMA